MEQLKKFIVVLVMVALIGAAGAIALNSFRTQIVGDIPVSTATNETITLSNGTAVSVANDWVVSVSQVLANLSGSYVAVNSANYTVGNANDDNAGTITLINAAYDGNTSLVTYTYHHDEGRVYANVSLEGLESLSNTTQYLDTIGTLIGVGALVGVCIAGFLWIKR